jgi:hypothetical protein
MFFEMNRTENSIKNHWNCSVKKREEFLFLAYGSDLHSHKTKAESGKPEEIKQSLDQKVNRERSADTCSLDLVLGIAHGKEIGSQPSNNSDTFRESHHRSVQSNELRNTSSIKVKVTHEPGEFINSSTSEALSGSLQLSLSAPSDVGNFFHGPSLPVSVEGLSKSSYGPQVNVLAADYSEDRNSKLRSQSKNSLSYLLETGSFPSIGSFIQTTSSPVSFHTPPTQNEGITIDCSNLESKLRSAARSFKNTPSIIRKRRLQISKNVDHVNNDDTCLQEVRNNSVNGPHLLDLNSPHRHDLNSVLLSNEEQLVVPPRKSQKLETSVVKSIEKCLEHEFDVEWDSANSAYR